MERRVGWQVRAARSTGDYAVSSSSLRVGTDLGSAADPTPTSALFLFEIIIIIGG